MEECSEENLHQIMYLSSATGELNEKELMKLLEGSRRRNAKRNVTGIMLYSEGNILHLIEGSEIVVKALFEKIKRDPRHFGIQLLWSKAIGKRDFPDYSMGFRRAASDAVEANIPGFCDFVESGHLPEDQLQKVSRQVAVFLKTFARSTRMEA